MEWARTTLIDGRSLFNIAVRDEAKEARPDARPQARKNRRCIRWNTLRIFSGRERRRWSWIVRRSKRSVSDRLLDHLSEVFDCAKEGILELYLRFPFQERTRPRDIGPSDFWIIGRQRMTGD